MASQVRAARGSGAAAPDAAPGAERTARVAAAGKKSPAPLALALERSGVLFQPSGWLAWLLGGLGAAACAAPWVEHGWLWLGLAGAIAGLVICGDGLALWIERKEFSPVLLPPERGLRGREGESLSAPLALTGSARCRLPAQVRVAAMPAKRGSEIALRVISEPQWLKLERPSATHEQATAGLSSYLWAWAPEIALLRRGLWPGLRVGTERGSRLGIWQLRQWFDSAEPLRIEADLRPGRREILRSPIYRSLVAARQTPWTGHGRDFERLREYQPGDNFSEIAWKSTARRGAPVTRLFQWEQKQEVYFVVDQSRSTALGIDRTGNPESEARVERAPRRVLDLAVETALVGATVALELGDEFGLVTFADEPTSWLRAGNGQAQFQRFRDQLLRLEPLATTADYEALFSALRMRLRRRAYLVLLAGLAERAIVDSLTRGVALVRTSHVVLMTSVLPAHARPAFSEEKEPQSDEEVYAALAGEKENQRLGSLVRRFGQWGVQLRFVAPEAFLRTAVEGYMESKREQRL